MRPVAARALALVANPAMRGIAGAAILKAVMIAFNFALIALAARALGEHGFGVYSILFSAAGLFCVIATFGQSMLIVRSWNEYSAGQDVARLKGALRFTAITCLAGSLLVGAGFFGWVEINYGLGLAVAVTIYMVLQGVLWNSMHLVRAAVGLGAGDGVGSLFVPVPALLYIPYAYLAGLPVTLTQIFVLLATGAAAAILVHLWLMRRLLRDRFHAFGDVAPVMETRLWARRSLKLWLSSGLETANQYLDVLLIGYLLSPAAAGGYFVVTRLANAFAAASDSLNMFATRHIPDLYYRGDLKQLGSLLNTIAGTTAAVVVVGMLGVAAFGYWVLALFNPAFSAYYPALVLLCLGTAGLAAAGPSASLLMLTGHEGRYLFLLAGTVVLRAIGFVVLTPAFGILGAVAATTCSFMVMALALRHATRSLTGLDATLLRLVGAPLSPARE